MSKQYAFWREPTGKPHKADDANYAPVALLTEIGETATLDERGGISWPGLWLRESKAAILSAIAILDSNGHEVNDHDARRIAWDGIKATIKNHGGQKKLVPKDVIRSVNKAAASHLRKRVDRYVLLSSLSISDFPATRIRVGDTEISPLKRRPTRFPQPDVLKLEKSRTPLKRHDASAQYQIVKVKTAGRSIFEAAQRGLDALNLLRGLWTLLATRGSRSMSFGNLRYVRIGVIHAGPEHTLHHPNGELVGNIYWYDPDYGGDRELYKPNNGWKRIEADRRWAARRMRRLPYRNDIERLLIRYAAALDHSNLDVAFLQMWSILEKMTNTVGGGYNETIRRATWSFADRHLARPLLESVRLRRNQFVHAAQSSQDRQEVAYMIKSFVEPHLLHLLRNDFRVESLEEYGEFLRLPVNVETLEKRVEQARRAIDFWKK